jgi:flagellar motor switch protein FliG
MAAVFREVDANVLQLALAGADEGLVDRVAAQLPKRAARQFRARLHQLGPTRLSDVVAAQEIVAEVATRVLAGERPRLAAHAEARAI